MLKSLIWIIYWSLLPIAVHQTVFPDMDIFGTSSLIVFLLSLPLSVFILMQPKAVQVVLTLLETLCFCILLGWHHFYQDGLTLSVLGSQYSEGVKFAGSTLLVLLTQYKTFWVIILCLIGVCCTLVLSLRLPLKKSYSFLVLLSVLIIVGIPHIRSVNPEFNEKEFMWEAKNLGYPLAWIYELNAGYNEQALFDAVHRNYPGNTTHPEVQNIKLPENIYMIQVESLDYNAVDEAMPFLQSLKRESVVYKIAPHDKKSSANIDFTMLILKPIYKQTYGVAYKMLPPEIYNNIKTLPNIMKKYGYYTRFFHGVSGHFFNRENHIRQMGFDEVYFKEDLLQSLVKSNSEFGIEDKALFECAAASPKKKQNFNFLITVSSHFPFDVKENLLFLKPQNIREKYLNSVHYVDNALKQLISSAPEDSLFIIYSDHHSSTSQDESTLFLLYSKQKSQSAYQEIDVEELPLIMLEILENNKLSVLLKS